MWTIIMMVLCLVGLGLATWIDGNFSGPVNYQSNSGSYEWYASSFNISSWGISGYQTIAVKLWCDGGNDGGEWTVWIYQGDNTYHNPMYQLGSYVNITIPPGIHSPLPVFTIPNIPLPPQPQYPWLSVVIYQHDVTTGLAYDDSNTPYRNWRGQSSSSWSNYTTGDFGININYCPNSFVEPTTLGNLKALFR